MIANELRKKQKTLKENRYKFYNYIVEDIKQVSNNRYGFIDREYDLNFLAKKIHEFNVINWQDFHTIEYQGCLPFVVLSVELELLTKYLKSEGFKVYYEENYNFVTYKVSWKE